MMQPPSKTKVWANEEAQVAPSSNRTEETEDGILVPEGESDEEYQVIAKKPKTTPQERLAEDRPATVAPVEPSAVEEDSIGKDDAEDAPDIPANGAGPISDADWLRSRTNRVLDIVEDDEDDPPPPADLANVKELDNALEGGTGPDVTEAKDEEIPEAKPREEDKIRQTGRLFLRNLHYNVTEDDLREHFAKYGSLEEVR